MKYRRHTKSLDIHVTLASKPAVLLRWRERSVARAWRAWSVQAMQSRWQREQAHADARHAHRRHTGRLHSDLMLRRQRAKDEALQQLNVTVVRWRERAFARAWRKWSAVVMRIGMQQRAKSRALLTLRGAVVRWKAAVVARACCGMCWYAWLLGVICGKRWPYVVMVVCGLWWCVGFAVVVFVGGLGSAFMVRLLLRRLHSQP